MHSSATRNVVAEDVGVVRIGEELDVVLERHRLHHHPARLEPVEAVAEQDQDRQQQPGATKTVAGPSSVDAVSNE